MGYLQKLSLRLGQEETKQTKQETTDERGWTWIGASLKALKG